VDRLVCEQPFRAAAQLVRVALIVDQPFLENLVYRFTFPASIVVCVDRILGP
jgi:hypothetical protein